MEQVSGRRGSFPIQLIDAFTVSLSRQIADKKKVNSTTTVTGCPIRRQETTTATRTCTLDHRQAPPGRRRFHNYQLAAHQNSSNLIATSHEPSLADFPLNKRTATTTTTSITRRRLPSSIPACHHEASSARLHQMSSDSLATTTTADTRMQQKHKRKRSSRGHRLT